MNDDHAQNPHDGRRFGGENSTDDNLHVVDLSEVDSATTSDMRQEAEEALRMYSQHVVKHPPNSDIFPNDGKLRIEVHGSHQPMYVAPQDEMVIGRRDPTSDHIPEIDLSPHAAYQLGLSRRHAILLHSDNHLHVVDQGSRNGTYLNGSRLTPKVPVKLHDGDELRMAKMVLRLYFQPGDSA